MNADQRWAGWLAGTLGAFAVLEARALKARAPGKPSGTLTATMRRWLGLKPRRARRFLLAPLFAGFLGYLWLHFLHGRFNA
ncbi:hypothetical protein [Amycolatopsis sp. CFH S0078]|uniref:hypothetical protein n=1 Tax=Amycolatopsis sp. CFH S0078 TaxID=1644108 RepID=UPI00106DD951|nr:hypothetical protein [Amycolatopsis sp. CFH S0078]